MQGIRHWLRGGVSAASPAVPSTHLHPSLWERATESRRDIDRRAALDLLAKLTARHADLVTDLDIEAGLRAILHGGDDEKSGDWPA